MRIEGKERISHPSRIVFETLRDKTPELAALMPNIESMTVTERVDTPPITKLKNRWQGKLDDLPKAIRPFVNKDIAAWCDEAEWNAETLLCSWKIRSMMADEIVQCSGTTRITADGDAAATFTLVGELRIDPAKVPGIPRFLAGTVRDPIERFIANALSPNLTSIAKAVQKYLDIKANP